jgi:hypothetical protein
MRRRGREERRKRTYIRKWVINEKRGEIKAKKEYDEEKINTDMLKGKFRFGWGGGGCGFRTKIHIDDWCVYKSESGKKQCVKNS